MPAPKKIDAEQQEPKPSSLMAKTKLKSRAENRPDSSVYLSSQLGWAASMVLGSLLTEISVLSAALEKP